MGNHEWRAVSKARSPAEIPADILDGRFLDPSYVRGRLPNATHVLEHEEVTLMGVRIFGSSWCAWHRADDLDNSSGLSAGHTAALKQWQRRSGCGRQWHRFDEIPEAVDVLLTHGAPRCILDQLEDSHSSWGSSRVLREVIQQRKPKVHLFGHIHEQRGYWCHAEGEPFIGGVEYERYPGQPWTTFEAPPATYPCQLIACTAQKNHPGLEGTEEARIAGPARLIIGEGGPGAWAFRVACDLQTEQGDDHAAADMEC